MKLAIVVQRYGADISGGAELHARYVAEHLAKHAQVEVLTTCARDYVTWRDEYAEGLEQVNGVPVRRFRVDRERDIKTFARLSDRVFEEPHSFLDELRWLEAEGPTSTSLLAHLRSHETAYDFVIFFSYRYYHAYHGTKVVPSRAILVPTAERDEAIGLAMSPRIFRRVRAVMYNSPEERRLIQSVSDNYGVPGVVVGIGSEIPERTQPDRFRQKYGISGRFALYVGRIDQNKGCKELFSYFLNGLQALPRGLRLVMIGKEILPVPDHPRIRHLGFLGDQDKFDALAAADLLLMPSYYESLSMVALEAWALGKPVLANGRCEVLRGQCIRSNAGLYYESEAEFVGALRAIAESHRLNAAFGANGRQFFQQHYAWNVIEQKYLDMLQRLIEEDRAVRLQPGTTGASKRGGAGTWVAGEEAHDSAAGRAGARAAPIGTGAQLKPRIHQVLATLGYGDAIGHEVLGIQRTLHAAGYESDIFVQTADYRLEDLTRDYRDLIAESHPSNILIHHFSIGSRASRIAYAVPDRQILIYHNITPPEFFVDINDQLVEQCFKGRRELGIYPARVDLALGDSEFNRQELEALGFDPTGVLPVVPDFSHLDVEPNDLVTRNLDDEWTNILFVGRIIPNKRIEDVIRYFHAYQRHYNPRSRLLLVGSYGGYEKYLAMLHHLVAALGATNVLFTGHVTDAELTAYYEVADLFLCASAHEGFCVPIVEAFYKQIPVVAYAATAVPSTMDGAGVLFTTQEPLEVATILDTVLDDSQLGDHIVLAQNEALNRLTRRDFEGTLVRFVEQVLASPRKPAPQVAWDFWDQFRLSEELYELQQYRPAIFRGLPESPESKAGLVEERR